MYLLLFCICLYCFVYVCYCFVYICYCFVCVCNICICFLLFCICLLLFCICLLLFCVCLLLFCIYLLLFCICFNYAVFWKELSCVLKILLQFSSVFRWLNMDCLIIFSALKREICDLYLGADVPSQISALTPITLLRLLYFPQALQTHFAIRTYNTVRLLPSVFVPTHCSF
jgi:hypothetical protein